MQLINAADFCSAAFDSVFILMSEDFGCCVLNEFGASDFEISNFFVRRKLFVKGKFCDVAYYSILREEFSRENREKTYNITYKEGFFKHFLRYR